MPSFPSRVSQMAVSGVTFFTASGDKADVGGKRSVTLRVGAGREQNAVMKPAQGINTSRIICSRGLNRAIR